jgi:LCP family protein required for cell wall assembly
VIAEEAPPAPGRRMKWRALAAIAAVVLMAAGATLAAGLLQLDALQNAFRSANGGRTFGHLPDITPAEAGKPQTIMILGTDGRLGADKGAGQRSDTIILARLNASKSAITLMSIPRDLKVTIPGYQLPDKINAAYSEGGTKLTLKTVKGLLSQPGRPFKINHVIAVNFTGFRKMVDYLHCAFIDVDRHYFNDIGGPGGYATINIHEGYQKLCGAQALSYVRYRHTDNDLVRGARQQDFIRELLRGRGVRDRLSLSKRNTLARIAGHYTTTDRALIDSKTALLSLGRLMLGVANKPVQQVTFGAGHIQDDGNYLVTSQPSIDETVKQFLNPHTVTDTTEKKAPKPASKSKSKKHHHKPSSASSSLPSGLANVQSIGENMAISVKRRLRFPFYYPKLGSSLGHYVDSVPRVYRIPANHRYYQAYRMVVSLGPPGEFYGIQGMTWRPPASSHSRPGPPILDGAHDTLVRNGRKLGVYYDGKKVRLVDWVTKHGVYWVSNTLTRDLSYERIVAIAASLTHLGK